WCVGVEVGGVVLTEDGGRSWTFNMPGGNPDLHNIVAKPDEPGVLFASTGFGRIDRSEPMEKRIAGMFRSDDHGKTWRFQWTGMTPPYTRPLCIDPRPPHPVTVGSSPTAFSSAEEMRRDPRVFLIGEDVAEAGHPFKTLTGLVQEFGTDRIVDTPISEPGYAGIGVGAAMTGMRPIVDVMFGDFITLTMDQMVN